VHARNVFYRPVKRVGLNESNIRREAAVRSMQVIETCIDADHSEICRRAREPDCEGAVAGAEIDM